jgi:hypothetical protein
MRKLNPVFMTHIHAQSEKELAAILDSSDRDAEFPIKNSQCLSGKQVRAHLKSRQSMTV